MIDLEWDVTYGNPDQLEHDGELDEVMHFCLSFVEGFFVAVRVWLSFERNRDGFGEKVYLSGLTIGSTVLLYIYRLIERSTDTMGIVRPLVDKLRGWVGVSRQAESGNMS